MAQNDLDMGSQTPENRSPTADAPLDSLSIADRYSAVHQLSDGTMTHVRLLCPGDREWLLRGFAELDEESRYRRFFTAMPQMPESVLQRLLNVDGRTHLAIAAESAVEPPAKPEPFGIARFFRLAENSDTAEAAVAAVAVVDHMQGRGLGKLLLTVLAVAARERGVKKFRAEVLSTNDAMRALLREFDEHLAPLEIDGGTATYDVSLPDIAAHETVSGPLLRFLKTAARGLEVRPRQLRDSTSHST
jgi:GNAT superfamily N-acetyltransferase